MFPLRENLFKTITPLIILLFAVQIALSYIVVENLEGITNFLSPSSYRQVENATKPMTINNLKDNWELMRTQTYSSEKIKNLAAKYNANSEYLNYIIKVEKIFDLQPCDLLALIAQESGFKPQTRMDGGSLSYSTTQMKLPAAITAYKAITEYYNMEIPYPTDELLKNDEYYATLLAGGYLRYLNDTYNNNKYESYSAYNLGIGGKNQFYKRNGHYKSSYAVKVASLGESFVQYIGQEYFYQDT